MNENEYLIQQIREEHKLLAEALAEGAAKDFPSYQNLLGRIQGLRLAQSIVEDLVRKKKEREDD